MSRALSLSFKCPCLLLRPSVVLCIQAYYYLLIQAPAFISLQEFCSVFPVGCWLLESGRSSSSACCFGCICTAGHKDAIGIFFRSLGFTLLCEFSFRFSYRFSGLCRASLNNSAFRIAAHSVCFLVGLVRAIKHLSNHFCSYQVAIRPRTFDCRYFSSLDPPCNGGSSIPWCIIFRSARSLSMASLHG